MKFFLLLFLLVSETALAQMHASFSTPNVISANSPITEKPFKSRHSHWLMSVNGEGMGYEVPFEFRGNSRTFKNKTQALFGGRLGVGREMYIGKGLMTTSRGEAYYMGIMKDREENAKQEYEGITYASIKTSGQIAGLDAVQSLSYLYDITTSNPMGESKMLTLEPFVEAGVGVARAINRKNYKYETGPYGTSESYRLTVKDTIANARLGIGFNVTSNDGYYFFMKVTQNRFQIVERKSSGEQRMNGTQNYIDLSDTEKNISMDAVTIYALGGGIKF